MSDAPRTDNARLEWDDLQPPDYGPCPYVMAEKMQEMERELAELKAWRAGQKGIEDYYIVKEKLYVAETAADMWRKCATNLAEAYMLDSNNLHSVEAALAEFEKLKGKP